MRRIIVRYKCTCMIQEASVSVAARRKDEDIEKWMSHLQAALTVDHRDRFPFCTSEKLEYAKIPFEENKPIGAAEDAGQDSSAE